MTPKYSAIIAHNVTSDYWIGLRKNSTGNSSSLSWSRWANGDRLTFQNWYPGWPVFKSPVPKINCCSCSCTCPLATTPPTTTYTTPDVTNTSETLENMSSYTNVTGLNTAGTSGASISGLLPTSIPTLSATVAPIPVEATCGKTPIPVPDLPDPNANYIEDSCVAMLSIGAWVEKNCTDLLPFICYEGRTHLKLLCCSSSSHTTKHLLCCRQQPELNTQ